MACWIVYIKDHKYDIYKAIKNPGFSNCLIIQKFKSYKDQKLIH